METTFGYSFPAIRGIQARQEYYVSMCPLRLIPRIFSFDDVELSPDQRAQRVLNKARIPEIARYILNNSETYVFSALTASVDAEVRFEPLSSEGAGFQLGILHIPMDARFVINDGQHRRAAIEMALRERPELGSETIPVVFFLDLGLKRCQQMFADLNRHAVKASTSLGILYDHRDASAFIAREVAFRSKAFQGLVELERSSLALRSRKLFTLSGIHTAVRALFANGKVLPTEHAVERAIEFWDEIGRHFVEWERVRRGEAPASSVREGFIHSHGIVLQALGRSGNALLNEFPEEWKSRLQRLEEIDWRRSNAQLWEGRAMIGGRVTKAHQNVILTTNVIKNALGLPLTPEEDRAERAFLDSRKRN